MTQAKASATASTWDKPAPKAGTGAGVVGDAMLGPLTPILEYMGHAKMGESGLVSAITRKRVPAVRLPCACCLCVMLPVTCGV